MSTLCEALIAERIDLHFKMKTCLNDTGNTRECIKLSASSRLISALQCGAPCRAPWYYCHAPQRWTEIKVHRGLQVSSLWRLPCTVGHPSANTHTHTCLYVHFFPFLCCLHVIKPSQSAVQHFECTNLYERNCTNKVWFDKCAHKHLNLLKHDFLIEKDFISGGRTTEVQQNKSQQNLAFFIPNHKSATSIKP